MPDTATTTPAAAPAAAEAVSGGYAGSAAGQLCACYHETYDEAFAAHATQHGGNADFITRRPAGPVVWHVGDGATLHFWTDAHAYTVIKVTAKTITIQRDNATPDPNWKRDFTPGGFMGHTANDRDRKYTYEADPEGVTRIVRLTKRGWMTSGQRVTKGRREYYDSNF